MSEVPIITALYVPGDRPDRFEKAVRSGAQLVIVDLEDAVATDRKTFARDQAVRWLTSRDDDRVRIDIRVNAGDARDLAAVAALAPAIGMRLPKVESAADVDTAAAVVGDRRLAALVETAAGVEALTAISTHPAVSSVALGEADLASDLGSGDQAVLDWVRTRLLVAVRAAGLPAPVMSVYPALTDHTGLRADTVRGRNMGFVGRTAVHPSQLPVIAAAFAPSAVEVAWAEEVLEVTAGGGIGRLTSGDMVDPAMRGRAERIVAMAAATDRCRDMSDTAGPT